jgi:type I restriction enzyme M protein
MKANEKQAIPFDYAKLSDADAEQAREDLVKSKGFFILPSELFENVRGNAINNENLNETLEAAFKNDEAFARRTSERS